MIEAKGLSKTYGATRSLLDVSFRVQSGEILGFLGPNGAGKSTTMKLLTGLIQPTTGSASINGLDVQQQNKEVRKLIGYLPEGAPVFGDMTVSGFLQFMGGVRGLNSRDAKKEMDRTTGLLNLVKERPRLIRNLSKGTKQRVAIAQALLGSPPVILLDEPTAGLDPSQINDVRQLITALRDKHTVIFSTHILPEVEMTCSRIVIIAGGTIAASGTASELISSQDAPLEIRVRGDEQVFRRIVTAHAKKENLQINREGAETVAVFHATTEKPRIARELINEGLDLISFSERAVRLEDIFLKAIGKR